MLAQRLRSNGLPPAGLRGRVGLKRARLVPIGFELCDHLARVRRVHARPQEACRIGPSHERHFAHDRAVELGAPGEHDGGKQPAVATADDAELFGRRHSAFHDVSGHGGHVVVRRFLFITASCHAGPYSPPPRRLACPYPPP